MDGGIVNNTPISHAVELGADQRYVLQAVNTDPLERAPHGVIAAGIAAMSRAITQRLAEDAARYRDLVGPDGAPGAAAKRHHANRLRSRR